MFKVRAVIVAAALMISQLTFGQEVASAVTGTFNCGTSGTYTVIDGVLQGSSSCTGALVLDSSVTTVEYATGFYSSAGLTSVTIPATTTTIYNSMPISPGAKNLTEFIVDASNPNYSSEDGILYNKLKTRLILYPYGKTGTTFTVPDSVTTISDYAFNCTKNLQNVTIGANVTSMDYAINFNGCGTTALREVTISASNPNYASVDGVLMNKAENTLLQYPSGKTNTSYILPSSVTRISNIDNNPFLTSITLHSNLTTIDTYAFERSKLTTVVIPDSVTTFGSYPFLGSTNLVSINVDNANTILKSIEGVLYSKNGTTLIEYPDGKTDTSFSIPSGVTTLEAQWVWGNSFLARLTVPASVTSIGYGYLNKRSTLGSYLIFEGNSSITSMNGDYAFKNIYCGTANSVLSTWANNLSKPTVCQTQTPSFTLSSSTLTGSVNATLSGYTISSITGADNFSISPTLISGLSFNTTTGLISGSPYQSTTSRTYTVTGTNSVGSTSQTFSLTVYTAAELAAIAAAQKAAAELAALEAALELRRQQIAAAKAIVVDLFRNSKPVSVKQFLDATYQPVSPKVIDRLNSEILKLSVNLRLEEKRINTLIDALNFDQAFYDVNDRPTVSIYNSYGIYGMNERILASVNQVILSLPSTQKTDLSIIKGIVLQYATVEQISNPTTRKYVTADQLIKIGLLSADSKNKTSILNALKKAPIVEINTYAKLQKFVSSEMAVIKARVERLAAIKNKIQARAGN